MFPRAKAWGGPKQSATPANTRIYGAVRLTILGDGLRLPFHATRHYFEENLGERHGVNA
jgi:hypothetical protein